MEHIPDVAWHATITGTHLTGRTLAEEIGESKVLLVFVRHLG